MLKIPEIPHPIPSCAELRVKYREAAMLFAVCYPRQEAGADKVLAWEIETNEIRDLLAKVRRGEIIPTKSTTKRRPRTTSR